MNLDFITTNEFMALFLVALFFWLMTPTKEWKETPEEQRRFNATEARLGGFLAFLVIVFIIYQFGYFQ